MLLLRSSAVMPMLDRLSTLLRRLERVGCFLAGLGSSRSSKHNISGRDFVGEHSCFAVGRTASVNFSGSGVVLSVVSVVSTLFTAGAGSGAGAAAGGATMLLLRSSAVMPMLDRLSTLLRRLERVGCFLVLIVLLKSSGVVNGVCSVACACLISATDATTDSGMQATGDDSCTASGEMERSREEVVRHSRLDMAITLFRRLLRVGNFFFFALTAGSSALTAQGANIGCLHSPSTTSGAISQQQLLSNASVRALTSSASAQEAAAELPS